MSNGNDTLEGGGAPAPAQQSQEQQQPAQAQQPAPKSDAEVAIREAEAAAAKQTEQKPPEGGEKGQGQDKGNQRNRTREYIERINEENRQRRRDWESPEALERRLAELKGGARGSGDAKGGASKDDDPEPQLEDFNFNESEHRREHALWAARQVQRTKETQAKREADQKQIDDTVKGYETKALDFAEQHDDFFDVVNGMTIVPGPEAQFYIMGHEMGPEIAYHLAKNEDDAFMLANVQPHLAAAAVDRIAARLKQAAQNGGGNDPQLKPEAGAKPVNGQDPNPAAGQGAPAAQEQPSKKISQAPQPTPTVSGKSAVETPPEKLTDDDWYKRDRERRRKR